MNNNFAPVVSVLGHVDHGKTSLLDAIRKTNITAREHGGITQKIGASSVEILHEGKKRKITFIDTPGHEAFSHMRGRGARVADIGILVVSSTDGVMPQTKESITLLQQAAIPVIVALTKADLPDKNPDKVKKQLADEGIAVEGFGGDIPVIEVSAKAGTNIKELLDLILLVFEVKYGESQVKEDAPFMGVIIESKLDLKSGPKATLVVKNGTVSVRDEVVADTVLGKVRALITDSGTQIPSATIGDAVEILGFNDVPTVGSVVHKRGEEQAKVAEENVSPIEEAKVAGPREEKTHILSLILITDTEGSLEALRYAIPPEIRLLSAKTGDVSEADVLLAKSTGSLILCFNIKIKPEVAKFALTEKVLLKNYAIIYELLTELREVMEGKQLAGVEQILGVSQVQAIFPFEKTKVMGLKVVDGRVAKGDKIRILRNDEPIGESHIVSVRVGKEQTSKVEKGLECGVIISPFLDFQVGDVILSHS